jgi:hypothetical protein
LDDVREKNVTEAPKLSIIGRRRASALRAASIIGRRTAVALGVGTLLLTGVAAALRAEIVDRVLAIVGTEIVTLSDERAVEAFGLAPGATAADTAADRLTWLVNRQLMLGEVDRYSAPDPEPAALDRRMARVRAKFPTSAQYEQALARTAMTDGRLRSIVAQNLRIETYLEQRFGAAAQPTPDEVQRYYREHTAEFTRGGRVAPFDDVQSSVQQKLTAERRDALIADWLGRLRRRGQVTIVQQAPAGETR